MRALVWFFVGSSEIDAVAGDVLRLSKEHAALLGPTAMVIAGPISVGTARVFEAEFAEALPTVVLPSVRERNAYTDCQTMCQTGIK